MQPSADINAVTSTSGFYAGIKPFEDFSQVIDPRNCWPAPSDWYVVIADIEGSTRAINEGRYKQVNMIGAACIKAVLNSCDEGEVPYVFGGDGATLLVSAQRLEVCKKALLGVQHLAETKFNLSLRIGVVPVSRFATDSGYKVLVGKYQVSPGNVLAIFSGGGVELSERWVKSDPRYLVTETYSEPPDLSGLSCRWEPLASQNGMMLSILVQVNAGDDAVQAKTYRELINAIYTITANQKNAAKPISATNMRFRWPPRGLKTEIDATVGRRNVFFWALHLYLNSLLQWCLDYFDMSAGGYRGRRYRIELRANTDYQRFDDMLHMLLDCSPAQADEVDALLSAYAADGVLRYGLHRADSALMTCLVFNLDKGEHIHFVDGNYGGFCYAARQLKSQLKSYAR